MSEEPLDPPSELEFRQTGGLDVLAWSSAPPGFDAIFTTRSGGVPRGSFASLNLGLHVGDDLDAVIENRRRAAAALDASLDDLVFARQVHGERAVIVGRTDRGRGAREESDAIVDADALVTDTPGSVLAVLVADCVPVVLIEPEAMVLACVHAGWRGTTAGVTAAAVDTMTTLGARAGRIVAGIGPCIEPERYQVGTDVEAAARRALGADADDCLESDGPERWRFDLAEANRRLLTLVGVAPDHIHVARQHTGPGGPFFSDRAERPCGRFALLARLQP